MRRIPLACVLAACAALPIRAARADAPTFRWSRPIAIAAADVSTGPGWWRLDLPDDVLAACRPGLPDLRLRAAAGTQVAYVLEQSVAAGGSESWPAYNVESVPRRETTALVDRGAHAKLADTATIELTASEFLKPVVIEASDDARDWKEIARGSIFATDTLGARARMTTLRFAPNDRRYWRVRLDDRFGAPVTPRAVRTIAIVPAAAPPRTIPLDVTRAGSEGGETTFTISLPSQNLPVSSLALAPSDAVFDRFVTVSERVLFRDEITLRDLGGATVARGPSGESLTVPLGELRGPALELKVADDASPPLDLTHATATLARRSLLFYFAFSAASPPVPGAPPPLSLEYGSLVSPPVVYDLALALAKGMPEAIKAVSLGTPIDRGAASPVGVVPHGAVVDESRWGTKAAIDLPATGGAKGGYVAYLPLEGVSVRGGVRIIDASAHEVPYVFEQTVHRAREAVHPAVAESEGRTTLTLASLNGLDELSAIELTAIAPEYFRRAITVVETVRDARGPTGERTLGQTTWERRPGEPATPLFLTIASPSQSTVEIRIENAGNAPLTLGPVTLGRTVPRIDFVYAPGDSLSLLAGNAEAQPPTYDLALLANALLALPAEAARLEPARDVAPAHAPPAKWFWVAVIVAGLGVAAALARAVMSPRRM